MEYKIIDYNGWKRYWGLASKWLTSQFNSVKAAIQNIDLTEVAKEETLGTSSDSGSKPTIFGRLMQIYAAVTSADYGTPAILSEIRAYVAKESSVKDGSDTAIGMLKDVAADAEIYAMFPGAVDENGNIAGAWPINMEGYIVAYHAVNNGVITFN